LTEAQYRAIRSGHRPPRPLLGKKTEDALAAQFDGAGIRYTREYRFLADRKFRLDFVLDARRKLAVEVDGQVHRIKGRFQSDREKMNLALFTGWRVLHVGPEQVRSGHALALAEHLLDIPWKLATANF